jgi:hypothetical protein
VSSGLLSRPRAGSCSTGENQAATALSRHIEIMRLGAVLVRRRASSSGKFGRAEKNLDNVEDIMRFPVESTRVPVL